MPAYCDTPMGVDLLTSRNRYVADVPTLNRIFAKFLLDPKKKTDLFCLSSLSLLLLLLLFLLLFIIIVVIKFITCAKFTRSERRVCLR